MLRPAIEFAKQYFDSGINSIVEVGILNGGHAFSMYNLLNPEHMYLVDAYINVIEGERFSDEKHQEWYKQAYDAFKDSKNITFILKKSTEASEIVPDNLDLVYIDAGHDEISVVKDIACWWPKIRIGGIICGHDFSLDDCNGVHKAVFRFFKKEKVNNKSVDWWVIKTQEKYDKM